MKKRNDLFYFLLIFFLLTACSGDSGSDGSSGKTIPQGLPPDPGEAGKATLEGIDSDNDGVRDDIQRYIAIEYPDSEKTRRVLTDMAKADQQFLLNADDKDKVLEADEKSSKAQDCSWYIDPETARMRHKRLKAELLNTEERIRAYIKADSQLGGMTFNVPLTEERKAQCSFDPDQLEN